MSSPTMELALNSTALISASDHSLELQSLQCSFCGLGEGQVNRLFEGQNKFICNECIRVCSVLMNDYIDIGYVPPWQQSPWYLRWMNNNVQMIIRCSFCGTERSKGEYFLASRNSQICERCVRACEALGG